jgi:hypothetical protein
MWTSFSISSSPPSSSPPRPRRSSRRGHGHHDHGHDHCRHGHGRHGRGATATTFALLAHRRPSAGLDGAGIIAAVRRCCFRQPSSELQPAFARGIGQRLDAAMEQEAAAIEHDGGHASLLGGLGELGTNLGGSIDVAPPLPPSVEAAATVRPSASSMIWA